MSYDMPAHIAGTPLGRRHQRWKRPLEFDSIVSSHEFFELLLHIG
jgi:hypothetical protein